MPMLPDDKTGLLKAFLGNLPGPAAARLAMAVEVDRLMEGRGLPHQDILDGLRPILRREHYERAPTPLRLFCRPFQDLLTCHPRRVKQKGLIARGTLVPCWNWISQVLLPSETQIYTKETREQVLTHRLDAAITCASAFWPVAAKALHQALSTEAGRQGAQKILGDAFAVADVAEMALLLSVGAAVEKVQSLLPPLVPSFHDELIWRVREVYDQLVHSDPDAAPYLAVIVMNRLARPWEALRMPLRVARHTDETLISKTDMGLVGEILFTRMDELKTAIQQTRHPIFEAETLLEQARTFADLSSHIVKEIDLKRTGEWGKRLLGERVQIGKVMEGFMDRAPREFSAALPMHKAAGADFSKRPGIEKQEMGLRYAKLVAGSRQFAAAASFATKQKDSYDELCNTLKRYNEDLVKALKADPQNSVVNAQFQFCTELTTLLFSEEEAELLRRRGRAAQSAAA
jgi:hypothetical protein